MRLCKMARFCVFLCVFCVFCAFLCVFVPTKMGCKKSAQICAEFCTNLCRKRFYAIPPLVIPPFTCHRMKIWRFHFAFAFVMGRQINSPRFSFAFAFVMDMLFAPQATIAGHTCESKVKSQRFSFAFAFVIQKREKILNPGTFFFVLIFACNCFCEDGIRDNRGPRWELTRKEINCGSEFLARGNHPDFEKNAPRIWAEILTSNQFRESLRELLRE